MAPGPDHPRAYASLKNIAVPFETGLNALWVSVGVLALGALVAAEIAHRGRTTSPARRRHFLAVVFAIIFLFPCVSASDDLLSFHDLQFTLETRGEMDSPLSHRPDGERPGLYLARLFESLQTFEISGLGAVAPILFVFALTVLSGLARPVRRLAAISGRSPPVLSPR